jgi:hypothetical protein
MTGPGAFRTAVTRPEWPFADRQVLEEIGGKLPFV